MSDQNNSELTRQMEEMRKELSAIRRWARITAIAAILLLFFPHLSTWIAEHAEWLLNFITNDMQPALGVFLAVISAAFVVAFLSARKSSQPSPDSPVEDLEHRA